MKIPIEAIVQAALTAPSGDNCQPFTFEWDGFQFSIIHQPEIAQHFMNPHFVASIITLGMMIELIKLRAQQSGFEIDVLLSPSLGDSRNNLWAKVTFKKSATNIASPLADIIDRRFTDRFPFAKGVFTELDWQTLKSVDLNFPHCSWQFAPGPFCDIPEPLKRSESFMWVHKKAVENFISQVHFSKREIAKYRTGFYWQELGVGALDTIPLSLMKLRPAIVHLLWPLGLKMKIESVFSKNIQTSAGLICLSADDQENNTLVNIGRQALVVWLQLQLMGYSVQPMTSITLPYYCSSRNWLGTEVRPELRRHFQETLETTKDFFHLSSAETPVWCLRFGLPSSPHRKKTSLRKEVSDVLSHTDPVKFSNSGLLKNLIK